MVWSGKVDSDRALGLVGGSAPRRVFKVGDSRFTLCTNTGCGLRMRLAGAWLSGLAQPGQHHGRQEEDAHVAHVLLAAAMTMSPTAVRTARRNLIQRIERFIKRVQGEGAQPSIDTIANFEVALECLEREDYPGGEDAVIWGEHGFAPRFLRAAGPSPISELIDRFQRLTAGE